MSHHLNGISAGQVAARELDTNKLVPREVTWVTERLTFTHGYGAVLSPVNRVESDGLPHLSIKDIPPVSTADLNITRPEIY